MYDYIKGIVTNIVSNAIILDNNGIGYLIYTPNPYSFHEGNEYKVFVFQNVTRVKSCCIISTEQLPGGRFGY